MGPFCRGRAAGQPKKRLWPARAAPIIGLRSRQGVFMGAIRQHVWYSGTVQGVGFRFTARRLAQRRNVSGYVKNLPDGRVELVAEGPSEEVKGFLSDVREALGTYIREAEVVEEAATGTDEGFGVAF